jgi:hypothetical protein
LAAIAYGKEAEAKSVSILAILYLPICRGVKMASENVFGGLLAQ